MLKKILNRREFLKTAGVTIGMLSVSCVEDAKTPQNSNASGRPIRQAQGRRGRGRPNIILIMADDLGYRETGCYGQKKIKTPNIDKLASQSMRFTQAYTSAPVCAPARCSLLTGKHGGHAQVRNNYEIGEWESFEGQLPLLSGTPTIANMLKGQGYVTGAFGKWGLGVPGSTGDPLRQGFDRFFGYNCQRHAHNLYPRHLISDSGTVELKGNTRGVTGETYGPGVIADEMIGFLEANKDKRFFLYYPTVLPHLALQVPEADLKQYKGKWAETPYTGDWYQPHPTPKACYAAMISFMDRQVGRIMETLKKNGLEENTVVIFTSDNGTTTAKTQVDAEFFESVGELRGLKGSLYEGGIRVPMIVRWPGQVKAGRVNDLPIAHYDIFATIAGITGGWGPADCDDSISFLPTLTGNDRGQREHKYLFWDFAGSGGQLAVRLGKWKGIKRNLKNNPKAGLEVYDLSSDPGESEDIAAKYPQIAERIESIMKTARRRPAIKDFEFGTYAD